MHSSAIRLLAINPVELERICHTQTHRKYEKLSLVLEKAREELRLHEIISSMRNVELISMTNSCSVIYKDLRTLGWR